MSDMPMTPDQEYEFYAKAENQEPRGPRPAAPRVPARHPRTGALPPELLDQARQAADADDRSLSAWIRRAVEHELGRTA
jgi:molybdopterin-guanine dinucleotide biosynthesis protein A